MTAVRRRMRAHAQRRAHERYGIRLGHDAYRSLVAQIESGRAPVIERRPGHAAVYVTRHGRCDLLAVYVPRFRAIATFLPMS